jgi:hypothetical protein
MEILTQLGSACKAKYCVLKNYKQSLLKLKVSKH